MINNFAVITCFFSYRKNPYMLERYEEFKDSLKRQGADLYTVELSALNGEHFIKDAFWKIRTDTVLWHKEALLNALVRKLPKEVQKIAWLDSDIVVEEDEWVKQAKKMLNYYQVLELGDVHTIYLDHDGKEKEVKHTNGYAYYHRKGDWNNMGRYHPGFGWMANRDFFTKVGLYEYDIIGGGDGVMMRSFGEEGAFDKEKNTWKRHQYMKYCPSILPHLESYTRKAFDYTQGNMGFVPTNVIHKFHGERANRGYTTRMRLLKGIDVDRDLKKDKNGIFEWKDCNYNDRFNEFFMIKNDLDPMNHYEYDRTGYVIYDGHYE